MRLDRLLLVTDTAYLPGDTGPAETSRQTGFIPGGSFGPLNRVITYNYDRLYRLTEAGYNSGLVYAYEYDPVGNRLQQIINTMSGTGGDATDYLYDAANRLEQVSHQSSVVSYQFDANGNLLQTGAMTNTWDAANRLTQIAVNPKSEIVNLYNGMNDRVGQTIGVTTTHFALDVQGLPEVIYTSPSADSGGESYLHLPGVIMTESSSGEVRYLLSDGLGSVRQAVDETAQVVAYYEFDPYGVPVNNNGGDPYGYTGEWYGGYTHLLHLRARWYAPETGAFLSRDAWPGSTYRPNSLQGYSYTGNNPVRYQDPSGFDYIPELDRYTCDDPRVQNGYGPNGKRCVVSPNTSPGKISIYTSCSPVEPEDTS